MSKRVEAKRRKKMQNRGISPILVIAGGILLLVAAVAFAVLNSGESTPKASVEVSGSPALRVDKEKVDLGDIKLGTPVSVSFTLTNVGDKTVNLKEEPYVEVKEGCWPPTPTIGSMVLKPGESTVLKMEFLMHGNMGGKHDFRVQIPSNDPRAPQELTVLSNWVQ